MAKSKNITEVIDAGKPGHHIYFIGIGGIGMSALARYFHQHGKKVSGFDRTETQLTKQLVAEGMSVHYEDNIQQLPKDADLVIYTPAIPSHHQELAWYRQHDYKLMKRSEVLGVITEQGFNICVAGTHGKTTVSTMIAHILRHTGYGCNAFLGGISVNYESNFWSSEKNVCVIEADEYDRSFLTLHPDIAVITAMDADHLDIYGSEENVQTAFREFAAKVKPSGSLLVRSGLPITVGAGGARLLQYHLRETTAGIHTRNLKIVEGSYSFDAVINERVVTGLVLNMGGLHNVENALAAIAVASELGIEDEKIRQAVDAFRGVKRRFEYIIRSNDIVFIDDYAHHPEELRALLNGVRNLYASKKCTLIFQPHLFTRTRDFADGFAETLAMADEIFLLPIYPAREEPIPGVTSEMIASRMITKNVHVVSRDLAITRISELLNEDAIDVLVTAGAGDIDTLVQPLAKLFREKQKSK
jgi:UDP-N-acetylmuramate--alanine ligase